VRERTDVRSSAFVYYRWFGTFEIPRRDEKEKDRDLKEVEADYLFDEVVRVYHRVHAYA
jgi:hypothetical protein